MLRAIKALLVVLTWPWLTPSLAPVAHASESRILVLDVDAPSLPASSRPTFAQGLASGLVASGASVVTAGEAARGAGTPGSPCADVRCWARLLSSDARAISFVARSAVTLTGSTYQLRVEMLDPRTGHVVDTRDEVCEICTMAEAAETLGMTASAAKVAAFKRGPDGRAAAAPAAIALEMSPSVANAEPTARASTTARAGKYAAAQAAPASMGSLLSGPASPARRTSTPSASSSHARAIGGWTLVAAGLASIATAIVLIELDGRGTCGHSNCKDNYATENAGIAAGVSGLLIGLIGGGILLTGPSRRDDRVASRAASVDGWGSWKAGF